MMIYTIHELVEHILIEQSPLLHSMIRNKVHSHFRVHHFTFPHFSFPISYFPIPVLPTLDYFSDITIYSMGVWWDVLDRRCDVKIVNVGLDGIALATTPSAGGGGKGYSIKPWKKRLLMSGCDKEHAHCCDWPWADSHT